MVCLHEKGTSHKASIDVGGFGGNLPPPIEIGEGGISRHGAIL